MTIYGLLAMSCIAGVLAWSLRGTTLWPIALPVALAFGESGFVQEWNLQVTVPGFPVPLGWLDIVFGVLVIAWLLVRRLSPAEKRPPALVGLDVAPLTAWLVMVALAVPLAWIDGGAIKLGIAWVVLSYCYVPLSFAILWDVLRRTDRATMWALLRSLSVIVSILAVFYVFHMLGWSLYDLAGVNSTYSYVDGVRRDILTFPVWACVTMPFLLWSERISVFDSCMIAVQIAAVAISLTRSLVLACGFAILIVVLLRVAIRRRPLQPLIPAGIGAIAFGAMSLTIPGFDNHVSDLLLSRFDELSGGIGSVANVASRLSVGERVSTFLNGWGLWMGAGFSNAAVAQAQANVGQLLVGDSLWSVVLLHFGILGVVIVGATLVVGAVVGIFAVFRRREEPLALAAVGAAALVWLLARTAASSEIMLNYPIVCAFVLALVTVEARDAWSTSPRALGLLLKRGDAPALPEWATRSTALKVGAVVLVILVEMLIGRMIAR